MKTITVAASKGGVGKSTVAAAIAVEAARCGQRVAMLDVDTQHSLSMWYALRCETLPKSDNPHLIDVEKSEMIDEVRMRKFARDASRTGIELLVVDTPPALMAKIEGAIGIADIVIVPARPSPLDLLALDPVIELCEAARCPFHFLVNAYPPRSSLTTGTFKNLAGRGKVFETMLGYRTSYAGAMMTGRTAAEIEKGDKAEAEIRALWKEIDGVLRTRAR